MTTNIVEAVQALIPDLEIRDDGDGQVELYGAGGLTLGVMFDIKPDMTIDYTRFSCAPFVFDAEGNRQLGHWYNWPFDHMYMQVEPEHLKDIFRRVNDYKV
jgi:hypothetical protein